MISILITVAVLYALGVALVIAFFYGCGDIEEDVPGPPDTDYPPWRQ